MLQFRELKIVFDPTANRRQRESKTATFKGKVRTAQAVLKGFNTSFTRGDRHIKEMEIDLDVIKVHGNRVDVAADFVLRDGSGHYDDVYKGFVECIVIADVV